MDIENFLNTLYSEIENCGNDQKSNLYFSIIQIKVDHSSFVLYKQSIYSDIKNFISVYIDSALDEDFGYDFIDIDKIESAVNAEKSVHARFELSEFCMRKLKSKNYEDLVDKYEKKKQRHKLSKILIKNNLFTYFQALLIISADSFLSILCTLFVLLTLSVLLLQKAEFKCFELYEVSLDKFSNNSLLNEILNVVSQPFGFSEEFKVKPINEFGLIILLLLKTIYIFFIGNFIIEKLKKYILKL